MLQTLTCRVLPQMRPAALFQQNTIKIDSVDALSRDSKKKKKKKKKKNTQTQKFQDPHARSKGLSTSAINSACLASACRRPKRPGRPGPPIFPQGPARRRCSSALATPCGAAKNWPCRTSMLSIGSYYML